MATAVTKSNITNAQKRLLIAQVKLHPVLYGTARKGRNEAWEVVAEALTTQTHQFSCKLFY